MTAGYENRRFSRSNVEMTVQLDLGQGKIVEGRIINVSLIGIFVTGDDLPPVGTECEAIFASDPLKPIRILGCVVHREIMGVGVEIRGIEGESFEALRSVIVDNAENAFECETLILSNMEHMPPLY